MTSSMLPHQKSSGRRCHWHRLSYLLNVVQLVFIAMLYMQLSRLMQLQLQLAMSDTTTPDESTAAANENNGVIISSPSAAVMQRSTDTDRTEDTDSSNASSSSSSSAVVQQQYKYVPLDLENAPGQDRVMANGVSVSVDLYYRLYVHRNNNIQQTQTPAQHTHGSVMHGFYGHDIWQDTRHLIGDRTGTEGGSASVASKVDDRGPSKGGSAIFATRLLHNYIRRRSSTIFVEVGVFRGQTSVDIAKYMDSLQLPATSFVISVDTWLLDLEFVWPRKTVQRQNYFQNKRRAGQSVMYEVFQKNVIAANATQRVVPLPSSSLNAAMALLAHQVVADIIYLDASHSNPDVFLDLVGMWHVLRPGGVMICDDYSQVPAVKTAVDRFVTLHREDILPETRPNKRGQYWITKKAEV